MTPICRSSTYCFSVPYNRSLPPQPGQARVHCPVHGWNQARLNRVTRSVYSERRIPRAVPPHGPERRLAPLEQFGVPGLGKDHRGAKAEKKFRRRNSSSSLLRSRALFLDTVRNMSSARSRRSPHLDKERGNEIEGVMDAGKSRKILGRAT